MQNTNRKQIRFSSSQQLPVRKALHACILTLLHVFVTERRAFGDRSQEYYITNQRLVNRKNKEKADTRSKKKLLFKDKSDKFLEYAQNDNFFRKFLKKVLTKQTISGIISELLKKCGGVAQLARATGSYPVGHGFKSNSRYQARWSSG